MDILSSLLAREIKSTDKSGDFERVFWLTHLMKWMQRPRGPDEKNAKKETVYTIRLKYILLVLNRNPEFKKNFVATMTQVISRISSVEQFTTAGLPASTSFIQEFIHRLQEKIIPKAPLSEDLSTLIYEIFPNEDESLYVDFIDETVIEEIFLLFKSENQLHQKLRSDLLASALVLSSQILNLTFAIQSELDALTADPQHLEVFQLEGLLRDHVISKTYAISPEIIPLLQKCVSATETLYHLMQQRGVKIDLVYLFQSLKRKMYRLEIILRFLDQKFSNSLNFRFFISHLILDTQHEKSLASFFSENLSLLTERIVKANSHIGEHYVTFNWSEFRKMFKSALGGGAVTALTVYMKQALAQLKLVGFPKGLVDSLNYSGSFLLIQIMGWTLATKQPSATAPFLASALLKSTTESRRLIVALLRTQFIAVLGNLSSVFPICFLTSLAFLYLGHPLFSSEEALHNFSSTDILGPSLFFAAFTGVLLFTASLFAGWFENWILVNRIDKRVKYNDKMHKYLGPKFTQKLADSIKTNSNSLAANITLGFLLGMVPQLFKFFGLPIEVRHVTLATGGFAAALPIMIEQGFNSWELVNSVLGILGIGLINISVSFSLAFLLASISSKVKFSAFWRLLKWGFHLIITRPWLLLVPEKEN